MSEVDWPEEVLVKLHVCAALCHRLYARRKYLESAKSLNPAVQTDAAFIFAKETLREQDELGIYNCLSVYGHEQL